MNHSDELYGQQWNEQMQHEWTRHINNVNNQYISCNPEDELIEEMKMYIQQLRNNI